jgi:hypothetical protein
MSEQLVQHETWKQARARLMGLPRRVQSTEPEAKAVEIFKADHKAPPSNVVQLIVPVVRPQVVFRVYPTLAEINAECCAFYELSRADLESHRRDKYSVLARHVAIYLAREMTPNSYPQIAKRLGGRDHSTAVSGQRKIAKRLLTSDRLRDEVDIIRMRISEKIRGRE